MSFDYIIMIKNRLDNMWNNIPDFLKYDRFESRELRNTMYRTEEIEQYEMYENSFLTMVRQYFNIEQSISLSEAYNLLEENRQNKKS